MTDLMREANEALVLAVRVLMRPVDGEPDQEMLDARMACLRAQDRIAREKPGDDDFCRACNR